MVNFLLSYDREDGEGGYVRQFYDDLCDELARRAGWDKDSIGYWDQRVPVGARWPDRLVEALRTCRVFVPLYSPRFYGSAYCGREWWIFSERVGDYEAQARQAADLIVPVVWESTS